MFKFYFKYFHSLAAPSCLYSHKVCYGMDKFYNNINLGCFSWLIKIITNPLLIAKTYAIDQEDIFHQARRIYVSVWHKYYFPYEGKCVIYGAILRVYKSLQSKQIPTLNPLNIERTLVQNPLYVSRILENIFKEH